VVTSQFESKGKANVHVEGGRRNCTNKFLMSLENNVNFIKNATSVLLCMFAAEEARFASLTSYLKELFSFVI
jgi:hypothetical protein